MDALQLLHILQLVDILQLMQPCSWIFCGTPSSHKHWDYCTTWPGFYRNSMNFFQGFAVSLKQVIFIEWLNLNHDIQKSLNSILRTADMPHFGAQIKVIEYTRWIPWQSQAISSEIAITSKIWYLLSLKGYFKHSRENFSEWSGSSWSV